MSLLLLKLTVDLFINGWYLGETDPAPSEEDKAFGFVYFKSLGVCPYMSLRYYSTVTFLLSSKAVVIYLSHIIYCYGLWKSLTTACSRIYSIVILFFGLKTKIFWSKSIYYGEKSLRNVIEFAEDETFISFMSDDDISESREAISYSVGYPVNAHIFSIWSRVQLPGNSGFWASIS